MKAKIYMYELQQEAAYLYTSHVGYHLLAMHVGTLPYSR